MGFFSRKRALKKNADIVEPKTVEPSVENLKSFSQSQKLSYQIESFQGVGKRSQQEDAIGLVNVSDVTEIIKKGFMVIVADGMGGMKGGSFASSTAVNVLSSVFDTLDYDSDIPSQINNAFLDASQQIYSALKSEGGSTAIACLFYDGEMYYSSVGDSYLMLKRDDELIRINRPHTVCHKAYMNEIIYGSANPLHGNNAVQKHALTSFLGIEECDDIDYFVKALPLHSSDVIMVCSDGVAGVLSTNCISSCLSYETPAQMCRELENCINSLDLPSQDNYAAVVIKCEY